MARYGRFSYLEIDNVADIFYTDAPTIDGTPYPWPAAEPGRAPRRLRTWQIAIVYAMIHTALMTAIVMLATASTTLGLLSLAIHGAALLIGLAVGIPMARRMNGL